MSNNSVSHLSCWRLSSPVRDALEKSVAWVRPPVSRWISQLSTVPKRRSPDCASMFALRSHSRSQLHFPALIKVAKGRPVVIRMASACGSSRWQISAERVHCQLMALPIDLPVSTFHAIAVSRWFEIANASIKLPFCEAYKTHSPITVRTDSQIALGLVQQDRVPCISAMGTDVRKTGVPNLLINRAFVLVVP